MPRRVASCRAYPFDDSRRASAAVGPKHGTPADGATVGGTRDQRRLGTGDHEVERGQVERVDVAGQRDVVAVPAARPGDRLLAPAATDDTDPHQASTPSKLSLTGASSTSSG